MNWTAQDAIRFHNWEIDMMEVTACKKMGLDVISPAKPPGYDLWKQGDNPLGLALTKAHPTHLVPPNWTSDATPIPLPAEIHEQPSLF